MAELSFYPPSPPSPPPLGIRLSLDGALPLPLLPHSKLCETLAALGAMGMKESRQAHSEEEGVPLVDFVLVLVGK